MSSVPCVYMVTEERKVPLPSSSPLRQEAGELGDRKKGNKVQGAENHYEDQILKDAQSLKS